MLISKHVFSSMNLLILVSCLETRLLHGLDFIVHEWWEGFREHEEFLLLRVKMNAVHLIFLNVLGRTVER